MNKPKDPALPKYIQEGDMVIMDRDQRGRMNCQLVDPLPCGSSPDTKGVVIARTDDMRAIPVVLAERKVDCATCEFCGCTGMIYSERTKWYYCEECNHSQKKADPDDLDF